MHPRVGQREAKQQCVNSEDLLKALCDRNASTLTYESDWFVERPAQRFLRRSAEFRIRLYEIRPAFVLRNNLHFNGLWAFLLQEIDDRAFKLKRVLTRNKAKRDLGHRRARNNCLRPFTLIASCQTIHFSGWPCPHTLEERKALFARQRWRTGRLQPDLLCKWKAAPQLSLPIFHGQNFVIEPFHGNSAVVVVELGQHSAQLHRRIGNGSPEYSRMQIPRGAAQPNFKTKDSAQTVGEGWNAGRHHAGIRNGDNVRLQSGPVFSEKTLQVWASYLFLSLNENDQIQRQIVVFREDRFDPKNMRKDLSFVVGRSPGKNLSLFNNRLERWRMPEIQGIRRLHVVVSVNEKRLSTRLTLVARDNDGISRRRKNPRR